MKFFLAIQRCPVHSSFMAISIEDDNGGYRLTPSKCCGSWITLQRWEVSPADLIADIRNETKRASKMKKPKTKEKK